MARQGRTPELADSYVIIRAARQLVTLHGPREARRGAQMSDLAIIPDGAVLVKNGKIEDVGTTRRIERLKNARDAAEVDATGSVVLPAFIDSATQIFFGDPKRSALESSGTAILSGMVRHGTLTAEVHNMSDLRLLRICTALQGVPATLVPSLVLSSRTNPVLLETTLRLKLAQSATVIMKTDGTSLDQARQFLAGARALGLPTVIQAAPGFASAAAFFAFEVRPSAIRCLEQLPQPSIQAFARSNMVVGCDQARLLIDEGGALTLGTHYDRETNHEYNMPYVLSRACQDRGITHAEAITASTVNAAYATGCAAVRGTLEPGKWADLVLYDVRDYSDIIRHGSLNQVLRVLRKGATIYRRGRVECQ